MCLHCTLLHPRAGPKSAPSRWVTFTVRRSKAQLGYIALHDPIAARRMLAAIDDTGTALAGFATGHVGRVAGTYEKSVRGQPYIIAYTLSADDTAVIILRVIHTSRDWTDGTWPTV